MCAIRNARSGRLDMREVVGVVPSAVRDAATCAGAGPETPVFQAYCGNDAAAVRQPRSRSSARRSSTTTASRGSTSRSTFVLERDEDGRVVEAFTPDFYLPEQDLYIEVTVMKQSLVTRKNRKLRELQRLYPRRPRQALLPARHRAPGAAIPAASSPRSGRRTASDDGERRRGLPLARRRSPRASRELGAEIARRLRGPRAAPRRAAQVERRLPRRPLARAPDPARARLHRARRLRRRAGTAACGSSRTSTRRSTAATCCSSRTSSTPG